jgi:hypothetical protein
MPKKKRRGSQSYVEPKGSVQNGSPMVAIESNGKTGKDKMNEHPHSTSISSPSQLYFEPQERRWHIENFTEGNVVAKDAEMNQSVYIGHCVNTKVRIPTKVNKITIDSCEDTQVILVEVINSVELVHCKKVELRTEKRVPTLQIDLSEQVDIYICDRNYTNMKIISANAMNLKIHVPLQGEDPTKLCSLPKSELQKYFETHAIPASMFSEQRVTQIAKNGQLDLYLVSNTIDAMKKEGVVMIESPVVNREKKPEPNSTVTVNFEIQYNTAFGEIIFVVGSIEDIGNWNPMFGKKMDWNQGGAWKLSVPISKTKFPFEYKYFCFNTFTKNIRWEITENRSISEPSTDKLDLHDKWEVL